VAIRELVEDMHFTRAVVCVQHTAHNCQNSGQDCEFG